MLAYYYQYIYLIIVILLTFYTMSTYRGHKRILGGKNHNRTVPLILWTFFFVFMIGLRPISYYFVDMMSYHADYQHYLGDTFSLKIDNDNFIFDNIIPWFATNGLPEEFFFLFIASIYFGCLASACIKLFPNDSFLAFVVYLGAFSTFSYGTNGIKSGAAASIFLLALAYRDNKILAVLFLWISLGFHHSMFTPIVAYVIACFYRNPKIYLLGWLISLLLAAAHFTFFQTLFAGYTDEHGSQYLVGDHYEYVVSGFRPDFILYSAVPIFVGYYLITKRHIKSDTYNFMWCVYTLTNCVFLLCTYASYINRIAYLSWLMLPFVLLYPFINISWSNYQVKYLKYVVYGHLAFTTFMLFVYYA